MKAIENELQDTCSCAHCDCATRNEATEPAPKAAPAANGTVSAVLYLSGLTCADCAEKIRRGAESLPGAKAARMDFVSQKLTLEGSTEDIPGLIAQAKKIIHKIEPEVKVSSAPGVAEAEQPVMTKARIIPLAIGILLFVLALAAPLSFGLMLSFYLTAYLLIGGGVLLRAIKNIAKGKIFDENFLMCIATIGAFAIGEYPEGVAVMLFYQIGEFFQDAAVGHSRKSIAALMDIRPDYANIERKGQLVRVKPETLQEGDIIAVKPGEKIPLDGIVLTGVSSLDTSSLTGESLPRDVSEGAEVLSGSVNGGGLLTIRVTKAFGESTVSRILDLVQNAGSKKSRTEQFITKFARVYTPVVVFSALGLALIPPLFIPGATFTEWVGRALIFLVVSCPCALVLSIPLSFFGGIGAASKKGILIKGGEYLEALNSVDTMVFDKTGTLTYGKFSVSSVSAAPSFSEDELLRFAAYGESYSSHPIARSIVGAYGKEVETARISQYRDIPGRGIEAEIDGTRVLVGSAGLLSENGISHPTATQAGAEVYVAAGGVFAGSILLSDKLRRDSKSALSALRNLGISRLVMLTGDNRKTAHSIAEELALSDFRAELLPHQKVEEFEKLALESPGKTAFVGDGINDAPVLARADVGIAMGGLGSDAAIEAADVVLMTDEPSRLAEAIDIARRTRVNVMQNILFALAVKGVILLLGALGYATMWEAVFGDVGVAVIAIFNSMRLLR